MQTATHLSDRGNSGSVKADHSRCKRSTWVAALAVAALLFLFCVTVPSAPTNTTTTNGAPPVAGSSKIQQIVETVAKKLSSVKAYTAEIESQSLDPNGGFDKFTDEITFSAPDKMFLKRKILVMHDPNSVGEIITTTIDGTWAFTRAQHSSWKVNIKALERAGGPSIEAYLALNGNIADPFAPYKIETLQLENETTDQWVLLAEYQQKGAPWRSRLTIAKKTGLLQKAEAVSPYLEKPVVLSQVKQFTRRNQIDGALFQVPDRDSTAYSDNTSLMIEAIKAQRGQ